jgi:hypothetical protein
MLLVADTSRNISIYNEVLYHNVLSNESLYYTSTTVLPQSCSISEVATVQTNLIWRAESLTNAILALCSMASNHTKPGHGGSTDSGGSDSHEHFDSHQSYKLDSEAPLFATEIVSWFQNVTMVEVLIFKYSSDSPHCL